jgi:hypothetical protein
LLQGVEVRVEMAHARIQSVNHPPPDGGGGNQDSLSESGAISIAAGRFGGGGAGHEYGGGLVKAFSAQSMWSYLQAMPVEAKLE